MTDLHPHAGDERLTLTESTLKRAAKRLQKRWTHTPLKLTQAQTELAAILGFDNWEHLRRSQAMTNSLASQQYPRTSISHKDLLSCPLFGERLRKCLSQHTEGLVVHLGLTGTGKSVGQDHAVLVAKLAGRKVKLWDTDSSNDSQVDYDWRSDDLFSLYHQQSQTEESRATSDLKSVGRPLLVVGGDQRNLLYKAWEITRAGGPVSLTRWADHPWKVLDDLVAMTSDQADERKNLDRIHALIFYVYDQKGGYRRQYLDRLQLRELGAHPMIEWRKRIAALLLDDATA